MNGRIDEAGRLLRLKEQRLDAARRALAAAIAVVRAAEDALARRDDAIAALDRKRAGFDAWFAAPPSDPRLIETALHCREHALQQRAEQAAAREADVAAMEKAEASRAEASREAVRAEARRDAAQQMLDRFTHARGQLRERRVEHELEERRSGAGALA